MQTLDVISVNLWQILISLCNLVILYLLLKKFLYAPVRRVLAQRQEAIDGRYAEADRADQEAQSNRQAWEDKLAHAQDEADSILAEAGARADRKGERMIAEAREKADGIVRSAKNEAEAEYRRAQAQIRDEIADVSAMVAEKLLGREISGDDQARLIDAYITELGDSDGAGD